MYLKYVKFYSKYVNVLKTRKVCIKHVNCALKTRKLRIKNT
jgi:hypothetical protein